MEPKLLSIFIGTVLLIIGSVFFQVRMQGRIDTGAQKPIITRILLWDPPWAFSFKTLDRLEARSPWWRILTIPVRCIKVLDYMTVKEWTSFAFFLLPFVALAYVIAMIVRAYTG